MGIEICAGTKMVRTLILPKGFYEHDFICLMKNESHGRNRICLLAMHHLAIRQVIENCIYDSWIALENSTILA
jgi:hypothetical protein